MNRLLTAVSRTAPAILLVFGMMPALAFAADLSKYRTFQFGTNLSIVAKQAGTIPSQAKVVQRRPALIQELKWRPQPFGSTSQTEPAKEVVLSFYDGELYRIVVSYDRFETEGLTTDDFVEAISSTYGVAVQPAVPAKDSQATYGDEDEVLARWQDPDYRLSWKRPSMPRFWKRRGLTTWKRRKGMPPEKPLKMMRPKPSWKRRGL
jgi:hypothetical protein